ncbi:MAG: GxxExxY protein [Acidobacteria bacterium]|nr:GxxExxY protein [Acidobacteriota bacterium]
MQTDERRAELNEITEKIIGCCYAVSNALGIGFLEKVYENALAIEFEKAGLRFSRQVPIAVKYEGQLVGDFVADMLVAASVLVELKAVRALEEAHFAQCMNYLKATGLPLCLLVNFGTPHVHVRRIVNQF